MYILCTRLINLQAHLKLSIIREYISSDAGSIIMDNIRKGKVQWFNHVIFGARYVQEAQIEKLQF